MNVCWSKKYYVYVIIKLMADNDDYFDELNVRISMGNIVDIRQIITEIRNSMKNANQSDTQKYNNLLHYAQQRYTELTNQDSSDVAAEDDQNNGQQSKKERAMKKLSIFKNKHHIKKLNEAPKKKLNPVSNLVKAAGKKVTKKTKRAVNQNPDPILNQDEIIPTVPQNIQQILNTNLTRHNEERVSKYLLRLTKMYDKLSDASKRPTAFSKAQFDAITIKKNQIVATIVDTRNNIKYPSKIDEKIRSEKCEIYRPRKIPKIVGSTKPHRFHPGTVALKEIRHYQKRGGLLMPKAPFARLVKELVREIKPDWRVTGTALDVLQEAAEAFIVRFMEDANLCTIHKKLVTVDKSSMVLAGKLQKTLNHNTTGQWESMES